MPNSNSKKTHNTSLGLIENFFVPHSDANHFNAQDVILDLVGSAKDISIATFNCFSGGNQLVVKDVVVANLITEIQTKLEMIEKILPLAFESEGV